MAPPTADPEGHDDFTDSYIKSRRRWLAIGLGGVIPGLLAAGVGILWNERECLLSGSVRVKASPS